MANGLKGESSFDWLPEGTVISFEMADYAELENKFGASWFSVAIDALDKMSVKGFETVLTYGLKREGKREKVDLSKITENLRSVTRDMADALSIAVHGKNLKTLFEEMNAMADKLRRERDEDPTMSREQS